jgi:hypothetical protein
MKARDMVLLVGLAGVAVWFLRKQLTASAQALISAPGELGSKIGLSLYDWINPNAGAGITSTDYIVTFPDGVRHAVNSQNVDAGGAFLYGTRVYTMKKDAAGKLYAV